MRLRTPKVGDVMLRIMAPERIAAGSGWPALYWPATVVDVNDQWITCLVGADQVRTIRFDVELGYAFGSELYEGYAVDFIMPWPENRGLQ
jgi:hypothetical protein